MKRKQGSSLSEKDLVEISELINVERERIKALTWNRPDTLQVNLDDMCREYLQNLDTLSEKLNAQISEIRLAPKAVAQR